MRKKVLLSLIVLCVCGAFSVSAQKIGRVDFQAVMISLPETDSAQVKLQALVKELQEQMETMRVEFNNKLADFQQKQSTLTSSIADVKQKELADLSTRMQEMETTAQTDINNMQVQLFQPIFDKVKEAVSKAGKAQGLTMVVDPNSSQSLVYIDETTTPDLTDIVIKSLGGTRKAVDSTATNAAANALNAVNP